MVSGQKKLTGSEDGVPVLNSSHAAPTTLARTRGALDRATQFRAETADRQAMKGSKTLNSLVARLVCVVDGWRREGLWRFSLSDHPEKARVIETLWMRRDSVAREKHERNKEGTRTHYASYGGEIGQMAAWRVGRTHSWIA